MKVKIALALTLLFLLFGALTALILLPGEQANTLPNTFSRAATAPSCMHFVSPEDSGSNVATLQCEQKLSVQVNAPRSYGWTIMDKIPVVVQLDFDDAVRIDVSNLQQGRLTFATSSFSLTNTPTVALSYSDGKTHLRLFLIVQSDMVSNTVPLSIDLRYSLKEEDTDGAATWRVLTLPTIKFNVSAVTSERTEWLTPEQLALTNPPRPLALPLFLTGVSLLLFFPVKLAINHFRRKRRSKIVPSDMLFWQNLHKRLLTPANADIAATTAELADAVLTHLEVQTLERNEIRVKFANDPRSASINQILDTLYKILYGNQRIDAAEASALAGRLRQIEPCSDELFASVQHLIVTKLVESTKVVQ